MMTHSPQDTLSMMDFVDSWFDLDAENDLHDWVLAYVSLSPMVMLFEFHFHLKQNRFHHFLLELVYLLVLTIPFPALSISPIVFGILHV